MKFKGFIRNRQQTTSILGLLLIVLSLTSLLGCPPPTPSVEPKTDITGTFFYTALSAVKGSTETSINPALTWTGAEAGQTVEYSITTRPNGAEATHVTVDTATGVVTITAQAPVTSPGTYTVTATGTGGFQGTKTATIEVTIKEGAEDIEGSFSYDGFSAVKGSTETSPRPTWTGAEAGQTVEYSITTRPNGAYAAHVTVNTDTGAVTITDQALKASSGEYTVTATGIGAFQGTKAATITITAEAKAITGSFSYDGLSDTGLSTLEGTAKTSPVPTWTGAEAGQTVEYSITDATGAKPTHVTVNTDTGVVTITDQALEASSGAYTVTATGTGDFLGTRITTIAIAIAPPTPITGSFSYDGLSDTGLSTEQGTAQTSPVPTWTSATTGQTVEYSITDATGAKPTHVTVNTDTGVVTITDQALEASSGAYTVTATGTGDFSGTRITTIAIAIAPPTPITGSFSYDGLSDTGLSTEQGTAQTSPVPTWTSATTGQAVEYSITDATGAKPTHVTVNTDTGVVTITAQAPVASPGTYTVTARGTGAFGGARTATIQITITAKAKKISGSFYYYGVSDTGLNALEGTPKTSPVASWRFWLDNQQTVEYSITARPSGANAAHVTIDRATGVFTVTGDALVASSGEYTITAMGTGAYTKDAIKITAVVKITIRLPILAGTLSYDAVTTGVKIRESSYPEWSGDYDPDQLKNGSIEYYLTPPPGTSSSGISISKEAGYVSVHAHAASAGTYTVTAKGAGAFSGEIIVTIDITIETSPITGSFSYDGLSTEQGTAQTSPVPTWTGAEAGQTVEYSITDATGAKPTHVTVNTDTGVVTITAEALKASSGEYTVTATGIGDFGGTKTATIQITITAPGSTPISGTLSYDNVTVAIGRDATATPKWEGHDPTQITAGYTLYTVTPTPPESEGITFHGRSGVFYILKPTTVGSETYTVTATGQRDYSGEKKATITITITAEAEAIEGSFNYDGFSAVEGSTKTSPVPTWTGAKPGQTVEYSFATRPNGANADHVIINTATGAVTVTDQALVASSGTYTVTATGTGDFGGTIAGTITITIEP